MGELIRRILAQLVMDRLLFSGTPVEALDRPDTFPTKYISEILGFFLINFPILLLFSFPPAILAECSRIVDAYAMNWKCQAMAAMII